MNKRTQSWVSQDASVKKIGNVNDSETIEVAAGIEFQNNVSSTPDLSNSIQINSPVASTSNQPPKSASQRSKEYRERKKLSQPIKPAPKSSTQRSKELRERQKIETLKRKTENPVIPISNQPPKSDSQRSKEYRERKKLSQPIKPAPKSSTQRSKELRERQKIETLKRKTEIPVIPVSKKPRLHYETAEEDMIQVLHTPTNNSINDTEKVPEVAQNEVEEVTAETEAIYKAVNMNEEDEIIYNINNIFVETSDQSDGDASDAQNNESSQVETANNEPLEQNEQIDQIEQNQRYSNYNQQARAHLLFIKIFTENTFGHACSVCDRLWWSKDLKPSSNAHGEILQNILSNYTMGSKYNICSSCKASLDKNKIPSFSTYNGFTYPKIPAHLPTLDLISQRLISPRIPFMQIRRLRHVNGQYGIYGQIINVPVDVNTMVNTLPRNIDDDHCFYVHLKKKLIHKSSYVHGFVDKRKIKAWLTYLVQTPLYIHYDITIDNEFFENEETAQNLDYNEISEHVPIEENLAAVQQTLLWNEDDILIMAPGQNNIPISLLFYEHAEELSFPTIFGGQFRKYKEEVNVTPYMQATSEIRRADRRGADPQHLLYLAAKIMRLRVKDAVSIAFEHTSITKEQIMDPGYISGCIETNLAFLRCIPNSAWYWSSRKKDLFAMMRQKGAPQAFMTLSCNEIGWTELLKLLYKLKHSIDISEEQLSRMTYIEKATLINEDSVTCAIYFNKMVQSIMHVLQAKNKSPFGRFRVVDYFIRIEFQNRGSPHAHTLLWLENAPSNLLNNDQDVINMIDELVSVSAAEASNNIKLQTHKHTFTCYKRIDSNKKNKCRFGAPFMPSKKTVTLFPMNDTDDDFSEEDFKKYKKHYHALRENLEQFDYTDFEHFYSHNSIESDQHYQNILRAGINRPKLFYRRQPSEKWYNPFNPFVFHHLKSNMDFQIIQDEFACAAYVVEYVNETNRGLSNLQRQIIETINNNPEFDIVQITRKLSVDVINAVEMSSQEAAWYLLRMPMAKSSIVTVYIPTLWPIERQRIKKTMKELETLEDDSDDIWKENWFDKYEKRPEDLNHVTLAQFVSKYYKNNNGEYVERQVPKVIRYRNYDVAESLNDYKREMVLLHIPFRNEEFDILAENKFVTIYEENQQLIMDRRKEFESNMDIEKTLAIIQQMGRNDPEEVSEEENNLVDILNQEDPYLLLQDQNVNADLLWAVLSKLGAIAKKTAGGTRRVADDLGS